MYMPVRFYSDGMRMRLAFALSLAMDFECYLIDEVILVGDRRFQLKCHDELFGRRKHCGMIMAVHDRRRDQGILPERADPEGRPGRLMTISTWRADLRRPLGGRKNRAGQGLSRRRYQPAGGRRSGSMSGPGGPRSGRQ